MARRDAGIDVAILPELSSALAHRGPDDHGYLIYNRHFLEAGRDHPRSSQCIELALIHRRLSIFDVSTAGWQPMSSEDGRYHIVYNGEIYNFKELRVELEAQGCRFRSNSDTEVLLAAHAVWGPEALKRLIGMFAFALFDARERQLLLARDFVGIKPLYYTYSPEAFAFASEIKALVRIPSVAREVDAQRAYDFLRYGLTAHATETMFRNIQQLPPAHYMTLSLDELDRAQIVRYWQLDLDQRAQLSYEEAASEVRDRFLRSVELHVRSDVPIGFALSGGIDSSSIIMGVRRLKGEGADLNTFSFVTREKEVSEEPWADLVASAAKARVFKVTTDAHELLDDLDRLIYMYDEPAPVIGNYAEYRLARLTHEAGIKVLLSGQGGDELFAGYLSYIGARATTLLKAWQWRDAARLLRSAASLPGTGAGQVTMETMGYLLPSFPQGMLRTLVGKETVPAWMNAAALRARGVATRVITEPNGSSDALRHALYCSVFERGLPHLLRYDDRSSMAFSVESRVPFLTQDLAQFIFSLPEEYLISKDAQTKAVFRTAMAGIVPAPILARRDKLGYAMPERKWMLTLKPWIDRVLSSEAAHAAPMINLPRLKSEWASMVNGQLPYGRHIWRCCQFIEWSRIFGTTTH